MRFSSQGLKPASTAKRSVRTAEVRHRVLIADSDTQLARRLADHFWGQGIECRLAISISEAKEVIEYWQPDAVFVDLMLPETNALSLCRFVQTKTLKKIPQIIVMSKHTQPQGIETMRRAGASHYLVKPFSLEDAFMMIKPKAPPEAAEVPASPTEASVMELHLLNLFIQQATQGQGDQQRLYNLMRMISLKVHALRCSIIQITDEENGLVLASNDDENVQGLPLKLVQYPEVLEVYRTKKPLIIPNIATSDLLAPVRPLLQKTPFETIALFPVFRRGEFYAVMSMRMEQKQRGEIYYIDKFGRVVSQILSLALST